MPYTSKIYISYFTHPTECSLDKPELVQSSVTTNRPTGSEPNNCLRLCF